MKKIIKAATIPLSLDIFCRGQLSELSQKYEVVALSSPDVLLDTIADREGVRVISIPMQRRITPLRDLASLCRLICCFLKEKPTMVHSMTPKAGLLCMLAAFIARVPRRVHTFTGLVWPTSQGIKKKILMLTDWVTCACATHIIPEGQGVMADLRNITSKPMRVLGYGNVMGVDMERFSRRKEILDKASKLSVDNVYTFLYVGRLVGDKGVNELVEAFLRINRRRDDVRLLLVGNYENLDPLKAETCENIKSCNQIEWLGPQYGDELIACYAASDCFVLPSYREGFPNAVLEAGAMGLPSIVTDINGSREIIENDVNGLIVPPRDTDALENAMVRVIDNREDTQRFAANARSIIEEKFEQGFVRGELYKFYDQILQNV